MIRTGLKLAAAMLLGTAFPALAQVPVEALAKPSADAQRFVIVSSAGQHGSVSTWRAADGSEMARTSILLRGQIWEFDEATAAGADGMPARYTMRGHSPQGDVAESMTVADGKASWTSPTDAGSADYAKPAFYYALGLSFANSSQLIERLLAAPDHTVALLPSGSAHAEKLTSLSVGEGAKKQTVTAWAITGISNSPLPIWATEAGKVFAQVGGLAMLPVGYEAALPALEKAQDDALAARSPAIAQQFLKVPTAPIAFVDVQSYDTVAHAFRTHMTVVVDKGVIAAAGPARSVKVPKGATKYDGKGMTLVPGLWDSHQHVSDDSAGPMLLSLGITSARDPGNTNPLTLARAERRAHGELLSPKVYPSVLIDGKGPNSAQSGTIVTSQAEAIAAVDKAKADGFIGVKFYGTFNPAWVKPAAAEAHKLGLHVHGHVPAGMRPSQAIAAGYDEITHIYFVMMEAMPDSVVKVSNSIARFNGPGRYAKDVDLSKGPIRKLINNMAAKHIISDPTLVVAESLFVPENGDMSPAYAPYVGTLPAATERGFRSGGFAPPAGVTRADFRASFAKLSDLVSAMHKAGVPIVAGTDGSGADLVRELELYVNAGFTPAAALEAATIVPARMVGVENITGSIVPGKAADLVLVAGDPSKHIGDLRHTRVVMMGGVAMDADALRSISGFTGRPK